MPEGDQPISDDTLIQAREAIEAPLITLEALTQKWVMVDKWAVNALELSEQDLIDYYADKYGVDINLVIGTRVNLKAELLSK